MMLPPPTREVKIVPVAESIPIIELEHPLIRRRR